MAGFNDAVLIDILLNHSSSEYMITDIAILVENRISCRKTYGGSGHTSQISLNTFGKNLNVPTQDDN
ncbi:hypothetical protein BB560_003808, partial [Smittium megazygosporum]